jgi:parallel beta-helix repeat protein
MQSAIVANQISPTAAGIAIGGENNGLQILDNRVDVGLQALGFTVPTFFIDRRPIASTGVLVGRNLFTGLTMQAIVVRPGRLNASQFLENVTSDSGDGIHVQAGNTGNTLSGNLAERNVHYGIWAEGAIGNSFEHNTLLGNGDVDARDDARESNTWIANECMTDSPVGTICGVS